MVEEVLKKATEYLRNEVAPKASEIDHNPEALRVALNGLCENGWMALRRPTEFGGPDLPEDLFRLFQLEVARYSGSLAFLQTQHQSAANMIAKCRNKEIQEKYLPRMADGGVLMAIAFSQLRRKGPPLLTAEKVDGGYIVNGEMPWITGYTFFDKMVLGAVLPDGRNVFGVTDFASSEHLVLSPTMELCAMEAAQTVSATAKDLFIPDEDIVTISDGDWIVRNDMLAVTLQAYFALGNARASLDTLESAFAKTNLAGVNRAKESLEKEWEDCVAQISAPPGPYAERVELRAWAIDLMGRLAHAGIIASSGAANLKSHPAQRIYREALVFTVSAQTADIMEACLRKSAPAEKT